MLRIVEREIPGDKGGRQLIDAIAQQLIAKATKGDLASIREMADRIEGTPARSVEVTGKDGAPILIENMTPEQKRARIAELEAKRRGTGS